MNAAPLPVCVSGTVFSESPWIVPRSMAVSHVCGAAGQFNPAPLPPPQPAAAIATKAADTRRLTDRIAICPTSVTLGVRGDRIEAEAEWDRDEVTPRTQTP